MSDIHIINNEAHSRFETEINGEYAYIEYKYFQGKIVLIHTFAPESMRGKGVSSALVKFALQFIKAQGLKAIIYCPFITSYLKAHPEYESQIDIEYRM